MMLALFDNTTSSDEAMEAVTNMRAIADKQCFISGMSGVVTDIKNLCLQELPIYVAIAALYPFIVLDLAKIVVSCIVGALLRKRLVQAGVLHLKEA